MPFARPTLGQLTDRVGAAYRAKFRGADTNRRHSIDRALVAAMAASTDEDLSFLDWLGKQLFPFSADEEYLERWAAAKGLARKGASFGAGTVTVVGSVNAPIPAGAELLSNNGVSVVLTEPLTMPVGGSVSVSAEAKTGGVTGNLAAGTLLTFVGTPAGLADEATVGDAFVGGAAAETDDELRLRLLRALAQPSFGGNQDDWEQAALAIPGVTRVFSAAATPTPGAITLWPLLDALHENGIPEGTDAQYRPGDPATGTGDQRLILDALVARRPVCRHVYVSALVATPIDLTIGALAVDTPAVRSAIATEMRAMLYRRAKPGGGIRRSWIDEAISRAAGEDAHDLVLPAGNVAIDPGHLAVLGAVTYV